MVKDICRFIVLLFGIFFIIASGIMLFYPEKARKLVSAAGTTAVINYGEITARITVASAIIICADVTRYPYVFKAAGWFMFITSLILYLVPMRMHHAFSVRCAKSLKPIYFRMISPFALFIGIAIIYSVLL